MSAPIPVEVIADALAEHVPNGIYCLGCDWQMPNIMGSWEDQHRLHQASVVAALPDIAIVDVSGLGSWAPDDEKVVTVPVCEACLRGEGGECHSAGCSFFLFPAPPEGANCLGRHYLDRARMAGGES